MIASYIEMFELLGAKMASWPMCHVSISLVCFLKHIVRLCKIFLEREEFHTICFGISPAGPFVE